MKMQKFERGQYWGLSVIQLEVSRYSDGPGRKIFLHGPVGWALEVFYGNKRSPFPEDDFEKIYLHQDGQVSLYQIETEVSILFQRRVIDVNKITKIRFIFVPRAALFLILDNEERGRIYGAKLYDFSKNFKWIDGVTDSREFISMSQAWRSLEELAKGGGL
jgi:hypothetical protein